MDPVFIAQAIFDKCVGVTMPNRHDELRQAFSDAGITLGADGKTVDAVDPNVSLDDLSTKLKSSMPTASMTAKRVLTDHS
ncbi:MAG: hypothetical protein GY722_15740 [bacterium]|nr:hypothetical protein [bacterium]MCP5031810.1 hypothetical protein [Actinomycetes bacterium]